MKLRLIRTIVATLSVTCAVVSPTVIDFIHPDNCSETDFFDTNSMKCEPCLKSMSFFTVYNDYVQQKRVQIKSKDGYSCVCRPGFRSDPLKLVGIGNSRVLYCSNDTTECPFGSQPMNGFHCAVCMNADKQSNTNSSDVCRCPKGHHLVQSANTTHENVMNLKCEKCHKTLMASGDGLSCQPCHQSFTKISQTCECPENSHIVEDGMCFGEKLIKKENLYGLSRIELDNTDRRFISDYFYRKTRPALYNCKEDANRTACQLLANLCVLYHYSYSDNTNSESNVCRLFQGLDLEFNIIYKSFFKSELEQYDVPNRFKINDEIQFIARRFSLNGRVEEYSDLRTGELQLCYENEKSSKSGFVFNTNFRQTCVRKANDLLSGYHKKNVFFELFLKNTEDGKISLYPIPILVRNTKRNNRQVNFDVANYDTDEDLHKVVLTRRFYLIDTITGIEKSPDDSHIDHGSARPKFIRVARSIAIDVKLRRQDGTGAIFPPLISILYETIDLNDERDNPEVKIDFSITYSMDDWKSKRDLSIAISVLCFTAVLWAIFRTWCWAKRNGKVGLDFFTLTEFVINTIGWLSIVFFVVNIVFAINVFIVFKNQSVIHTLLPTEAQESSLKVYIIIALVLKFVHVLYKLLVISTADIFFIDWERPKKSATNSLLTLSRPKSASTLDDNESDTRTNFERQLKSASGLSISSPLTSPAPNPSVEFPNVTVWRSNFVSNEWMELCGCRRLSLTVHILLVIVLLDLNWFGFANLAFSDPNNSLVRNESQLYVPQSTTCRLAVGTLVYAILALLNLVFKKFIYETLINDKIQQFVDLCSVCNISLFAIIYKRFGYYIHGLAANGKSDVNMLEMYELLDREEHDLCSKRGLLPNSDQQTFEMFLPTAFCEHYQRLRSQLSGFGKLSDRMRSLSSKTVKADTEKLIPTYLMINKFLTSFIEHNFKDVDYMVREKSTFEAILDVEFGDGRDKGFFYSDNGHSFETILFYGLEFNLICFEIMLFLVSDLCFNSFTLSAIIVFFASKGLRKLYLLIARRNLSRKALLDERFLI